VIVSLEQRPEWLAWANAILGTEFHHLNCAWISSLDDDSELLGVVIYNQFTQHNVEMSVASVSPKFLHRRFLRAIFQYPFDDVGVARVSAVVEADRAAVQHFDERIGFIREATLKKWFGNKDGILYRMTREECPWVTIRRRNEPVEKTANALL
jgi:RimJ/RimL family protein N-acetyltransferase